MPPNALNPHQLSEADTCRKYVVPKLHQAGWDNDKIAEQRSITNGRIVPTSHKKYIHLDALLHKTFKGEL